MVYNVTVRFSTSGGSSISQVSQATNVTKSANIKNYIQYQFVLTYKTIFIEDSLT